MTRSAASGSPQVIVDPDFSRSSVYYVTRRLRDDLRAYRDTRRIEKKIQKRARGHTHICYSRNIYTLHNPPADAPPIINGLRHIQTTQIMKPINV